MTETVNLATRAYQVPQNLRDEAELIRKQLDTTFNDYFCSNHGDRVSLLAAARMVLSDITLREKGAFYVPYNERKLTDLEVEVFGEARSKQIYNNYFPAIKMFMETFSHHIDKTFTSLSEKVVRQLFRQHAANILVERSQDALNELGTMVDNGKVSINVNRIFVGSPKVTFVTSREFSDEIQNLLRDIFPNLDNGASLLDRVGAITKTPKESFESYQISVPRGSAAHREFGQLSLKRSPEAMKIDAIMRG